jgi:hypothetical protein
LISRWFVLGVVLALNASESLSQAPRADSLKLRYARIRAEPTTNCSVVVRTSGSMNIQAFVSPSEIQRWIDSTRTIVGATPHRAKGQRLQLAWIPNKIGFMRTITDRFDAVAFTNSGHEIPVLHSEVSRIIRLLDSAAAKTIKLSSAVPDCRTTLHPRPPNEEL